MEFVNKYFTDEKNESLLFIVVGIIAVTLSAYFLFKLKQPFTNGIAYAILVIGLIQITVGSLVLVRSPKDIIRVNEIIQTDKSKIKTEEIPRMETVIKNFVIYRWVEIFLIVVGIILMYAFAQNELLKGIGLGLFAQSAIMLLLDFFAEKRGLEYFNFLQKIIE